MKKHQGKYPVNSRITIDYSGKKPKVKFGYIDNCKKEQINAIQNAFVTPIMIVMLLGVLFCAFMQISPNLFEPSITTSDCQFLSFNSTTEARGYFSFPDFHRTIQNDTINGMSLNCSGQGIYYSYSELSFTDLEKYDDTEIWAYVLLAITVGGFFLIFAIGPIIYYCFPWFAKYLPEFQKKQAKIFSKVYRYEFHKIPKNKIIEIPSFHNVYMDYEAVQDFGKYLKKIEIKEHPYSILRRTVRKGKIIKERTKKNMYDFYARFYFKRSAPKRAKGYLRLEWH